MSEAKDQPRDGAQDDDNLLEGSFREIDMTYFRKQPGKVMLQVGMGRVFLITHGQNKKPVAVLSRPPGEQLMVEVDGDGKASWTLIGRG